MQLTRWTPRHRAVLRRNIFPSFVDDFFTPVDRSGVTLAKQFMPSVDIYEKDETIFFEVEAPGFNKEDLHVSIKDKQITLSGERKSEKEENEGHYRKERRYGKFERSFHLGFEAESDAVKAKYENGILTVEVPKPQEVKPKKIAIN